MSMLPSAFRQAMNGGAVKRSVLEKLKSDHALLIDKPLAPLREQHWSCKCGKWASRVPDVGAYGRTTSKARAATTSGAHERHVCAIIAKAMK